MKNPITISEAMAAWSALHDRLLAMPLDDEDSFNAIGREMDRIAALALSLPVTRAEDVWHLVAMTMTGSEGMSAGSDALIARAHGCA